MLFYFAGLLLFYYYHRVAGAPPKVEADQVLGYFINQHLPPPVPGLIVAALLAPSCPRSARPLARFRR